MKNHYKTLGISQNASQEEIKKAYIQLAVKYHPDKNPADNLSEQFKEINEAKQVLLNDLKKLQYDKLLVDFLTENNGSKFKNIRRKRTKRLFKLYYSFRVALKKNRLLVAMFSSVIILVSAAFFQIPPDEPAVEPAAIQSSLIQSEKKPLEAKAVALSSFEPTKMVTEKTPATNKIISLRPVATVKELPKKKKTTAIFGAKRPMRNRQKVTHIELSDRAMAKILNSIRAEKQKLGNNSNCVQIMKTKNSNIQNAFMLANFLRNYGFVISCREKADGNGTGININARGNCIKVILGAL